MRSLEVVSARTEEQMSVACGRWRLSGQRGESLSVERVTCIGIRGLDVLWVTGVGKVSRGAECVVNRSWNHVMFPWKGCQLIFPHFVTDEITLFHQFLFAQI